MTAELERIATSMLTPQRGAQTSVYLASAAELATRSGGYYRRCQLAAPSRAAQDGAAAERLWSASAALTGLPA